MTPAERYGLTVLLDLSRLLPVDDPLADVVELTITEGNGARVGERLARGEWTIERGEGLVRLPRTLLTALADLVGAGAEQRSPARDRFDRVPSQVNPLVQAGAWRVPVANRLGIALRDAATAVAGRRPVRVIAPWPEGRRWAAAFTHDLDVVAAWPVFTLLRLMELARGGQIRRIAQTLGAAALAVGSDPVWRAAADLLAIEESFGVRSTWFVLCGTPTAATWRLGDLTYRPEGPRARRLFAAVRTRGHEIGLHGSFATLTDAARFRAERERLGAITGRVPTGVRQHFLRTRPGVTQHAMLEAGFDYDSSYGFPDRNGFRLGVADVVPSWDEAKQAPTALEQVPLVWMDRALSKYHGVEDPAAWMADALELADACIAVDGLWVGLWHPNLVAALGFPGAPQAYRQLLATLMARGPFVASLEGILAWRRARRSARAIRVGEGGQIQLSILRASTWPLTLEDPLAGGSGARAQQWQADA